MNTPAPAPVPAATKSATVTLANPIQREGGEITTLTLRKPNAGELRGLKMTDLLNADVNAVIELVPRICSPFITREQVSALEADDFAELAGTITLFFMNPAQQEMVRQITGATA